MNVMTSLQGLSSWQLRAEWSYPVGPGEVDDSAIKAVAIDGEHEPMGEPANNNMPSVPSDSMPIDPGYRDPVLALLAAGALADRLPGKIFFMDEPGYGQRKEPHDLAGKLEYELRRQFHHVMPPGTGSQQLYEVIERAINDVARASRPDVHVDRSTAFRAVVDRITGRDLDAPTLRRWYIDQYHLDEARALGRDLAQAFDDVPCPSL